MKLFEKILLGIVLFTFLTQPLVAAQGYSYIPLFFLTLSYFVGGYWLFNVEYPKQYFTPIVSGILLACCIYTIPLNIHLAGWKLYVKILPAAGGLLFLTLIIYLLVKRGFSNAPSNIKGLLIRASVICIVTCFFSYTPLNIKPFRKVINILNQGNEPVLNNMFMCEYIEDYKEAYAKGDCDEAITYPEKSNRCGLIWLGKIGNKTDSGNNAIDTNTIITYNDLVTDTLQLSPEDLNTLKKTLTHSTIDTTGLWQISDTYDNLYSAYKCKADHEYEQNNYGLALKYYLKADSAACLFYEKKEPRAWSLKNIALCYRKLKQYSECDSLINQAINICLASKDTFGRGIGMLLSDLAKSYSEQKLYTKSNTCYRVANTIFRKDSLNGDSKSDLLDNYGSVAKNFVALDDMANVQFYLQQAFAMEKPETESYCNTSWLYGVYLYKLSQYQSADSILRDCIQCFKIKYNPDHQIVALCNLTLAYVDLALAKYDDVKKCLDIATPIIVKNYGKYNSTYAQCLMLSGDLNKILSEYKNAESDYRSALDILDKKTPSEQTDKAPPLTSLANLEISLSRFSSAKEHVDAAYSLAASSIATGRSPVTNLLNDLGYVYYATGSYKQSDTLYDKTVSINNHFSLSHTASTAIALNGLGLNATAKRKFPIADSLFAKALKLHLSIFHEKNPYTAQVYLNYGLLNIEQGKLTEAEEKINKALEINKEFFKPSHDIFGDIYIALGDLSKKQGRSTNAKEYYQKALDIYTAKFNADHWKVVLTKRKIKGS